MAKKKEPEVVKEEIASLPNAEVEKPKKRGRAKKEEEMEELIIDGVKETDTPTEEQPVAESKEAEAEIEEAVDNLTRKLREIYSTSRSVKYAKKDTIKQLIKESETSDGWRDDDAKVKNEYDRLREETAELSLAVDNSKKEIKTVILDGIEPDEDIAWVCVGHLKNRGDDAVYKIKIAVSELTAYTQSDFENLTIESETELTRTLKDIASRWAGAEVQVVINKVYEERQEAYASRLAASEMLARWNFRRNSAGAKKPNYSVGSKVKAEVVEVKRDRMKVSVYGQDTWIKSDEIFWGFENPVYDKYSVGDYVNVLLLDVIPDFPYETQGKTYHLTKVIASVKQATPNPMIKKFKKYSVGGEYLARPIYRTKSGRVMCITYDDVNILATPAAVNKEGKVVKIRLTGKDDETYKLWGDVINPRVR